MGEIIFYKKFDTPKKWVNKVGGKAYTGETEGEYICLDERVEKFWLTGSMSAKEDDDTIYVNSNLLLKDGTRFNSNSVSSENTKAIDQVILEAEKYIQLIGNK